MINPNNKLKANELRKAGKYEEAILIYRDLCKEGGDKFDETGFLHCLRKLCLFDEALQLSEEIIIKYPNFKWCKNEVIWTYIQGELNEMKSADDLENGIKIAEKIMSLNPEDLAAKSVVLKILKLSKDSRLWDLLNAWINKIDPETLNSDPVDISGKKGWSEQARWYYYRILGLINTMQIEDALLLIEKSSDNFPFQKKFFLRLKAESYYAQGKLEDAESIFKEICAGNKIDWWILHKYSKLVRAKGSSKEALHLMCKAASENFKLDVMVNLIKDIGNVCEELGKYPEARNHLSLCRYIRERNGWSISELILAIDDLNKVIGNDEEPKTLEEATNACRNLWNLQAREEASSQIRRTRHNLKLGVQGIICQES